MHLPVRVCRRWSLYEYYYTYHMSNSHECMGVNEEGLPAACSLQRAIFCTTSHVRICISTTRKSVSGTTSHVSVSECAMKSKFPMIHNYHHRTNLYCKISLVCCRWHCYACNTLVTIQTATNL